MIINLSAHDDYDDAKAIISRYQLEDYSYFDTEDVMSKNFDIIGVPASFYIDEEGLIKAISFGEEDAEGILEKINK